MGVRLSVFQQTASSTIDKFFARSAASNQAPNDAVAEGARIADEGAGEFEVVHEEAGEVVDDNEEMLAFQLSQVMSQDSAGKQNELEDTANSALPANCMCPICGKSVSTSNNMLNQHIDLCLNSELVKSKPIPYVEPQQHVVKSSARLQHDGPIQSFFKPSTAATNAATKRKLSVRTPAAVEVDPLFLEALPDDLRAEVLAQHNVGSKRRTKPNNRNEASKRGTLDALFKKSNP